MAPFSFQSLTTILLTILPLVTSDCNGFAVTKDYFTRPAPQSQIISRGFVCDTAKSDYSYPLQKRCNSSTECPTSSYGVVNSVGTNNLSLTEDQVLPLYNLVYTTTSYKPLTFLYSLSSDPGNVSTCLHVKTANETSIPAGYWAFTPFLLCIQGTLSQCTNGPVSDGTPIEICAVDTFGSTAESAEVNGETSFVVTDAESAANLTSNPAATISPIVREPSSTTSAASSSSPTTSSAERMMIGGLVSILTVGMLFVL